MEKRKKNWFWTLLLVLAMALSMVLSLPALASEGNDFFAEPENAETGTLEEPEFMETEIPDESEIVETEIPDESEAAETEILDGPEALKAETSDESEVQGEFSPVTEFSEESEIMEKSEEESGKSVEAGEEVVNELEVLANELDADSMIPEEEEAEESNDSSDGNVTWEFDAETSTLIISGTGGLENYDYYSEPWYSEELDSVIIQNGVTSIGDFAFFNCNLTHVEIPSSVTSIGENAFALCKNLTSAEIPSSVKNIGEGAFYFCTKLSSAVIPYGVTEIGPFTFAYCNLTNAQIPEGMMNIGDYAFYGNKNLKSVTIPKSVIGIGEYALGYYTGYTEKETKVQGFTIYGYTDTAAEIFANGNGLKFVNLEGAIVDPDDPDKSDDPLEPDKIIILSDITDSTYTLGLQTDVVIHCSGALEDFISVSVDGRIVNDSNYTLEEGSTILTFKSTYLETLNPGEHNVTLRYTIGSVDTVLTVLENLSEQPGEDTEERPGEDIGEQPGDTDSQKNEDGSKKVNDTQENSAKQEKTDSISAPKTGDNMAIFLWGITLSISAVSGAAVLLRKRI